jgi:hypothetical protein
LITAEKFVGLAQEKKIIVMFLTQILYKEKLYFGQYLGGHDHSTHVDYKLKIPFIIYSIISKWGSACSA